MTAAGIDALMITSPENVYYTSGALIHTQALIRRRQAAVVLPVAGQPVLVVSEIEAGLARRTSQIADIVTYREFEQSAVQRAAGVLTSFGQIPGTLGVEMNTLPVDSYRQLQGSLPAVTTVAADSLLAGPRRRKGPGEARSLAFAARALDRAIAGAVAATRVGSTEEELATRIARNALELGGGRFRLATGLVASGPNLRVSHHIAGTRALEPGDAVRVGCRAVYEGYHALVARTAAVGALPASSLARYERLRQAHRDLLTSLVPGASGDVIYGRALQRRQALELELTTAHVGHGIGLEFQEDPVLRRNSADELSAGDFLLSVSVTPDPDVGYLYIEEMVEVGSQQSEVISNYLAACPLLVIDA
jgi:Xaa-Pro aminopeptidase